MFLLFLNKHLLSVHEDEKPYKCAVCEYKYSQENDFTKHIESVHDMKKLSLKVMKIQLLKIITP